MHLRPLLMALVVGTTASTLCRAADPLAGPLFPEPVAVAAEQTACYGVMGEVARPGVYDAPVGCTLSRLLDAAGGPTDRAEATVRIFRNGRLAQQVFLGSRSSIVLFAGDLVVAERSGAERRNRIAAGNRTEVSIASRTEVQIGFLNLTDRPVVVKMAADQATVARIVAILRQAGDLAAKVRVLPPIGANPRAFDAKSAMTRLLDSGTVLVFPPRSVRIELLPALPPPIRQIAMVPAPVAVPSAAPPPPDDNVTVRENGDRPDAVPNGESLRTEQVTATGMQHDGPLLTGTSQSKPTSTDRKRQELSPERPGAIKGVSQLAIRDSRVRSRSETAEASWVVLLASAIATIATIAMLLTLTSMIRGWLGRGLKRRATAMAPILATTSSQIVPPAPVSHGASGVRRAVRIDAAQPMTRLGIDLAIIEQAKRTTQIRG